MVFRLIFAVSGLREGILRESLFGVPVKFSITSNVCEVGCGDPLDKGDGDDEMMRGLDVDVSEKGG